MSKTKNLLCVANDTAAKQAFEALKRVIEKRDFEVKLLLGMTPPPEGVTELVDWADIVLLGMSSTAEYSRLELLVGDRARGKKPIGTYGDQTGCCHRAYTGRWFHDLAPDIAFHLAATVEEEEMAQPIFTNARIIRYTGSPSREAMAFPTMTRKAVRALYNIEPDEKVAVLLGTHYAPLEFAMISNLADALADLPGRSRILYAPHPRNLALDAVGAETHEPLDLFTKQWAAWGPVPLTVIPKGTVSGMNAVLAGDVVIEPGIGSTIFAAVYQRLPCIIYRPGIASRWLKSSNGLEAPEVVAEGLAAHVMVEIHVLAQTIRNLLNPVGFARMKARQEKICPIPKTEGAAAARMADVIEEVLAGA